MDREFIYRQTLVWLEMENVPWLMESFVAPHREFVTQHKERVIQKRQDLAESLNQHLGNNWEQIQRAKDVNYRRGKEALKRYKESNPVTRDTPEYYDRGE